MNTSPIERFLQSPAFAVIGASSNREKYGNKVLRCYMQHRKVVYPVNPLKQQIEGIPVVHSINELPKEVKSISVITPPQITEYIVDEAIKKGIENIWMQPGTESDSAIKNAIEHRMNVIAGGPCILVFMGYEEH